MSLDDFSLEFSQHIRHAADAGRAPVEDAFFDLFSERLCDCGEFDTAHRAHYAGSPRSGIRVDGYGGDPIDADGVLTLIALDYDQSASMRTLTRTEMDAAFRRLTKFVEQSLRTEWRNALEETSPAFGLADLISRRWRRVEKVRLFLLSNRRLSQRVDGRSAATLDGREVVSSVWDITRLHRFESSGREREDMELELDRDYAEHGGAIPLLAAHADSGSSLESYLAVVPGSLLARIYDRWGDRLLEQNVRVFLQARGKVNKGIRQTIDSEPSMFFAYNNGITATAEEVEITVRDGRRVLTRIKNLQVVNGGQTTGSIYRAYREGVDLSGVFVQMKLSRIAPERSAEVVRNISRYANTQNRVSAADFFSNHPFHIRMEEFSRRIYAPSKDGTFQQTKWFYERARGQYASERAKRSPAQRRAFDGEHPRQQVVTKTDLAKYMNVWRNQPHQVSLGAQKNFALFAAEIGKAWKREATKFNEAYFREVIAKAIVFKATERLVSTQPWYQGGYRANIVAYAIAKLGYDSGERGRALNFDDIWRAQNLPSALEEALAISARGAHEILTNPPAGFSNVTEWAKKPLCWERVQALRLNWPRGFVALLLSRKERKEAERASRKDQRGLDRIQAQAAVVEAGSDFWTEVLDWGRSHKMLSPREVSAFRTACALPHRVPTEKEAQLLIQVLARLRGEGSPYSLPAVAE